jgi:prepilin-type N-terminal cleavage/methylation domain-containing protein
MNNNENGFSLIELAVSAAILTTLSASAAIAFNNAANNIQSNIEEAKWLAENNPNSLITFE